MGLWEREREREKGQRETRFALGSDKSSLEVVGIRRRPSSLVGYVNRVSLNVNRRGSLFIILYRSSSYVMCQRLLPSCRCYFSVVSVADADVVPVNPFLSPPKVVSTHSPTNSPTHVLRESKPLWNIDFAITFYVPLIKLSHEFRYNLIFVLCLSVCRLFVSNK